MERSPSLAGPLRRAIARAASVVLGLCVLLLLSESGAYLDPEYGLPMLAAMGTAGCVGQLLALLCKLRLQPGGVLATPGSFAELALRPDGARRGEDWPLLVALLFGPLAILLSGLGGWVEAR